MRIAIAGIMRESLTFSPLRTRLADFRLCRGKVILNYPGMDLTRVSYKYIPRPIFPLDQDFEWRPAIGSRQL